MRRDRRGGGDHPRGRAAGPERCAMFRTRLPRGSQTPGVPRSPRRGAPRARLRVEALEPLIAPAAVPLLATATDQASGPRVRVFNRDLSTRFDFFAYDTRFTGG